MSGRHRKPTKAGLRLAQASALTVMAMSPLAMTGSAMAAPADADHDSSTSADRDSSSWDDEADWDEVDSDDEDEADEADVLDQPEFNESDWRTSDSPRSTAQGSARTSHFDSPRSTPRSSANSTARGAASSTMAQSKWDNLAQCESTQNWDANTGNGYKGGLQFSDATWRQYGGQQYATSADQASRAEQIAVAQKVQQEQGWQAWPHCSKRLGYT
jgi:hypothetical protein